MLLNCGVGEDSESSLDCKEIQPVHPEGNQSLLFIHCKKWCSSWHSNALATWCEELTHWKRPWCWERLKVGGEGDDRGWDGWMASPTQWTWVWVSSGRWWWTGRPGVLQSMGSQRVGHDWATELNWTEYSISDQKQWVQVGDNSYFMRLKQQAEVRHHTCPQANSGGWLTFVQPQGQHVSSL